MGRVRNKTIKRAAKLIIEKYYSRLTLDFQVNKRICDEVAMISTKRMRNKIAGFLTHLMRRIQKGPVQGISFKLQEEERERKDNYVPDVSEIALDVIEIDADTQEMLRKLNFGNMSEIVINKNLGKPDTGRKWGNRRGPRKF